MTFIEAFIQILKFYKINHIFGVPGDFILSAFKAFDDSTINLINTCDEQGAGFAADAYARLNGIGVVCVTYGVGALKIVNTTAQSYAEKNPVLVISGAPSNDEKNNCHMLHHKSVHYDTQLQIFKSITHKALRITNLKNAINQMIELIHTAQKFKGPVYLEIPRDLINLETKLPQNIKLENLKSNKKNLVAIKKKIISNLKNSKKPMLLLGTEIQRFDLQDKTLDFAKQWQIPIYSTIMAKSVISESHPLFKGVYQGHLDNPKIAKQLESSDCVICLGTWLTDVNLGIFTSKLKIKNLIQVMTNKVMIDSDEYENILLSDVLAKLSSVYKRNKRNTQLLQSTKKKTFKAQNNTMITTKRLFECLNSYIDSSHIIISDVGDCLFGALSMNLPETSQFLSPAYYTSMGFAVPAALATQSLFPEKRSIVIVGDGAFQMTGMEVSTLLHFNMNPIIIILNNKGYATERPIQDGSFNNILSWNYHLIPKMMGKGIGINVNDEISLINALSEAEINDKQLCLIQVNVKKTDYSQVLKNLAEGLKKQLYKDKKINIKK